MNNVKKHKGNGSLDILASLAIFIGLIFMCFFYDHIAAEYRFLGLPSRKSISRAIVILPMCLFIFLDKLISIIIKKIFNVSIDGWISVVLSFLYYTISLVLLNISDYYKKLIEMFILWYVS